MVTNNHNLIYSFLKKNNLSIEDYYGLAAIGLCKAGKTYKGDKSSFATYAYKCMFTTVMSDLRKTKRAKSIPEYQIVYYQAELKNNNGVDTSMLMNYIASKENVEINVLSSIMLDEYVRKLKNIDKKILVLFAEGYKQREISQMVGCSQAKVSRVKKKLCSYLES